ncbi:chromatin protein Cren7 [Vulcanisaeta sp. JCM 16159]|uniref:chromatin protein Cren7 n=1 Tax=Vulcanisaeta sp. JCM 16159 TaxID=1295371 RepID=UPI000B1D6F04|nr:chromatin protein Cren7 [Vulcanisaeta sp. JCM 16159]
MAELSSYMEREYEVDCDGQVMKLKPIKVWMLAPKGRRGVIIGLFKCQVVRSLGRPLARQSNQACIS